MIHVFYINLDERPDRREAVETQLKMIDCTFERVPAIKHTPGYVGCSASHLRCLELAKQRNLPRVMIVEDDLEWVQRPSVINEILKTLPPHDAVVLAPIFHGESHVRRVNDSFVTGNVCQTALAYICEHHYYDKLLQNFRDGLAGLLQTDRHETFAVDQYWKRLHSTDNWIFAHPTLAVQRPGISNIEGKHVDYTAPYFNKLHVTSS